MGYFASQLKTNATPYFLDTTHPSRLADKHLKEVFKGSGEVLIIATRTNKETIFNEKSLYSLYIMTHKLENLTLTTSEDVDRIKSILKKYNLKSYDIFDNIKSLKPKHYFDIKNVYDNLIKNKEIINNDLIFLKDLMVRVWPIKKVRGIVRIESITAKDSESFNIHSMMPHPLKESKDIKALENEALNNQLLRDILFTNKNKRVANTLVELRILQDDAPNMKRIYDKVNDILNNLENDDEYYISGPPAIFAQTSAVVKSTSDTMFPFVIFVVMFMLYLIYRDKTSMLLPIMVAVLSVVWTLGTMVLFGYKQNIVSTMIPVFLISIGVSDSIHILSEYSKSKTQSKILKFEVIFSKIMKPMLFTSLTTMIGFLALTYTPISFLKEFGIFVAIGVLYAFIITITLIPSVYFTFNVQNSTPKVVAFDKVSRNISNYIIYLIKDRRKYILFLIFGILLLSLLGIKKLQIDNEMIEYFSKNTKVYIDTKFIDKNFGGSSTVEFILSQKEKDFFKNKDNIEKLDVIISKIRMIDKVGAVYGLSDFIKLMNKGLHEDKDKFYRLPKKRESYPQYLFLYENSNGNEIFNVVNENYSETRLIIFVKSDRTSVMENIVTKSSMYIKELFPNINITPAGFGETLIATRDEVIYSQINSLAISFIAIFIFLTILFKNIRVSLLGMIPLCFIILINFGIMGWFGLYLDVGTAIVAAIAIGLGVDNAIYFISYFLSSKGDNMEKSEIAVASAFHALFSNMMVLGSGFLVLVLAQHKALVNLGWLISSTVILSTSTTLLVLPIMFQIFYKEKDKK
jgi:predicted RND superfamily exporter protein